MPPPVITALPLAGCVTESIVFGPPPVSLAKTSIAVAPESSATVAVSSTATGALTVWGALVWELLPAWLVAVTRQV